MEAGTRHILGYTLISLLFLYVIFNTIVIIYYALDIFFVYIRRVIVQCRRKKLHNEALGRVEKINQTSRTVNENNWFVPYDTILAKNRFVPYDTILAENKILVPIRSIADGISTILERKQGSDAEKGCKDEKSSLIDSESESVAVS